MKDFQLDISLNDVQRAAETIRPYIRRTPVWDIHGFNAKAAHGEELPINLKLECVQNAGSFKTRGVLLSILALTAEQRARGVVAMSAGNHAIAVAYAGAQFCVPTKVVMPKSANPLRIRLCRNSGAEVIFCNSMAEGFELVEQIAHAEGRTLLHPFESRSMVLGGATLAAEWLEQSPDLEALVIPVGGGGLIAGVALAAKQIKPSCQVFGVEPFGADSMYRSFQSGVPERIEKPNTIADTLGAPFALPYSFGICHRYVDEVVRVTDDEICAALYRLSQVVKLAVEPAGAVAAAGLCGPLAGALRDKRVGLLICGANIDAERFAEYLLRGAGIEGMREAETRVFR